MPRRKSSRKKGAYGTAKVIVESNANAASKHKFGAVPQVVDGIHFASTKEARRYQVLKSMEQQGQISELKLQPKFELVWKCKYKADFEYIDEYGNTVIEDEKGYQTREYKRKRKLMKEQHVITIKET